MEDLGERFTEDLTAAEVRHLVAAEWAHTAEDVLWRRSKLGLLATEDQVAALRRFIETLRGQQSRSAAT
jgi:glycerol-3-phosphate dehydrogenase